MEEVGSGCHRSRAHSWSGYHACHGGYRERHRNVTSVNPVAVHGEQQSLTTMTLKVRGVTFYSKATQYVGYGYSPYASGSWSAYSEWLDKAGTFAFCATS